jgi:hypothetical protein
MCYLVFISLLDFGCKNSFSLFFTDYYVACEITTLMAGDIMQFHIIGPHNTLANLAIHWAIGTRQIFR